MQKRLLQAGNLRILPSPEMHLFFRNSKAIRYSIALLFCICMAFLSGTNPVQAQSTTITTETGTGFTGSNGVGSNSAITFVVENTNTFPIILTGVDVYWTTGNSGAVPTLWYSTTDVSGAPNISAPNWTSIVTAPALTVTASGYQPVFTNLNFTIPAGAEYRFAVESTSGISYSGSGPGTPSPNVLSGGGVNLKVHDATIAGSYVGWGGSFPSPANNPRGFTGRIHFQPALPCVAPPTAGQAISTVSSVCPNTNFRLSLTGASGGMGMTYQWQISPNGTTGWTDIAGANNATLNTTQTTTNFYRAQLTCSGQTASSAAVQVTTSAIPTSGVFTINKNAPASATNFQSFTDAIAAIECGGINGAVVFDVVAGSGPYTEKLYIPFIPGSDNFPITFNGHGNTLTYATTSGDMAVVRLDGAQNITIDSLTIEVDNASTAGWGVHLFNNAVANTISNSNINLPLGSTSSTLAGIIATASLTSTSTNGITASNTAIINNTITGGYYGIRINGDSAVSNMIFNNRVHDFYLYGIYVNQTDGIRIFANDIARPTRSSTSTFYGIYVIGAQNNSIIANNRIHDPFGANTSSTSAAYGMYTNADANVGTENLYFNNLLYDFNSNGTIYAIYNVGADGAHYFHNTIALNDQNTTSSSITRGVYQTTQASNIVFRNNIISITRSTSGVVTGIYLNTAGTTFTSSNNVLYINSTGGTNIGYANGSSLPTLVDWQTAGFGTGSVTANPVFASPSTGFFQPTNSLVNNIGVPIAIVTEDIEGNSRSGTNPDPGAYEFTPAANDAGIVSVDNPTSPAIPGTPLPVEVTLRNFGAANLTSASIAWSVNGVMQPTYAWTGNLASFQTTPVTIGNFTFTAGTHEIKAWSTLPNGSTDALSANDTASITIISCSPSSGVFTINAALPTGGTNFASFTEAVNKLVNCGINGAVTLNVVAGSGPYNEKIEMPFIPGSDVFPVTINGRGNTLTYATNSGDIAVVRLIGAQNVTIDSLNIVVDSASTEGWGVHFMNNSMNNTLSNSNITIPQGSTSSLLAGIVASESITSLSTTGESMTNTTILNNTISGGYYGMRLNGNSTTPSMGHTISGNTVEDFYYYGMYLYYMDSTMVERNDISRPTRTTISSTTYAMYVYFSQKMTINANRIHNPNGVSTTNTTLYGIYTSGDAPQGRENMITNNLLYDLNARSTVYAIYNSSADGVHYYHNTVALDNPNISSTSAARAFYQVTTASNIEIKNNIFSITRGGTGTKHALYFGTTASSIVSDNNVFHVDAPSAHVGYYSGNKTTLADWQTANSNAYDQNSVAADPQFTNPAASNYEPSNGLINNIGTPVGVMTDITGATRSTTTPDPGAYEFTPPAIDLGALALVEPVQKSCYGTAEPVTIAIRNMGSTALDFSVRNATVSVSVTGTTQTLPVFTLNNNSLNNGQPLAAGDTLNVTVGTLDMTNPATYSFVASTSLTNDANNTNDTMAAVSITVAPFAVGTASASQNTICQSGVTTLNLTGTAGGDIQWQQGTSATGPFANIAGATADSYTLANPITQTTYYQAIVSCGTNIDTTNMVTVTVENPQILTSAGDSRCDTGVVNLTASASAGSVVNWYSAATGGTPLHTGNSYSPSVTATTTFYAAASTSAQGGITHIGAPSPAIGTISNTTLTNHFMIFDVLASGGTTIQSVDLYPGAAVGSAFTIVIQDNANNVVFTQSGTTTVQGTTTPQTVMLNATLPAGTGYRLGLTSNPGLNRNTTGASYPYTLPGVISFTGNTFNTAYYYFFYNIAISTGCESTRVPVVATVNTPATPTITQSGNTLTASATTGTYQWYSVSGTTLTAIPGATSQSFTPTANGTYSVKVTANGCESAAATAVNVVLGLHSLAPGMKLEIYPNPTEGKFAVELTGFEKDVTVQVMNLTGQVVATESIKITSVEKTTRTMNLSGMATGVYILKVSSGDNIGFQKVVLEK